MTIFRYNDLLYRGTNIVCNELLSCSEFGRILNKRKIKFSFFHSFGFFSFVMHLFNEVTYLFS